MYDMNIDELLTKHYIKCDEKTLLKMWSDSDRYYHNINHLKDLMSKINNDKINYKQIDYEKLIITALFHNCIYDISKNDNKDQSAKFLIDCSLYGENYHLNHIKIMILDTKDYKTDDKLSNKFINYDLSIANQNFDRLLIWEKKIAKENSGNNYKNDRLVFLNFLINRFPNNYDNLNKLIKWVKRNY